MTNRELEERLISFSAEVIDFTDRFRKEPKLKSLVDQIVRSASSVSLNYGEDKLISRAENALESGRLISFSYDGTTGVIRAKVA